MTDLVFIDNGAPVTTSATIAEGVCAQHKNVLELIRKNVSDFQEFGRVTFETRRLETAGGRQHQEVAVLNEQQATLLMTYMRNSPVVKKFKKRLVKAFYEGAGQASAFQVPQTLSDALRLASEQAARIEEQEKELASARPAAEFARNVTRTPDAISVGEAAKVIGTGRGRLFSFLRRHGWVTKKNEPYQLKIRAGLMDVKLSRFEHPDNGLQKSITPLITGKGLAKLEHMWRQHAADQSREESAA